jgi:hypothetical protein
MALIHDANVMREAWRPIDDKECHHMTRHSRDRLHSEGISVWRSPRDRVLDFEVDPRM